MAPHPQPIYHAPVVPGGPGGYPTAYAAYPSAYAGYPGYPAPYGGAPAGMGDEIDLAELARILFRKWVLVASVTGFALLSAAVYIVRTTPIYEASCTIELSLRRPRIMSQQDAVIDDAGRLQTSELLNTQLMKLQGQTLRKAVAVRVTPLLAGSGLNAEDVPGFLQKNVEIELLRRSNLVRIAARHPNPKSAAQLASIYADEAQKSAFHLNKESSKSAVAWLEAQIETQGRELAAAEQRLLEFRRGNPLDTLDAQRETIRESLLAYNRELNNAVAVRDELLSRYTEQHPDVVAQDQQIAAARRQYDNELKKSEGLEARIAEARTRLDALERDKAALEMSYRGILTRMEEARLSADENTATIKIVEEADVPGSPVHPRKPLILLLALFAGGVTGCALALLSNRLEDRIWGPTDVEQDIGLKLLGLIPAVDDIAAREELALASFNDKFSLVAEAFSAIRGLMDARQDTRVYLFTSTMPGEGKTICASNTAIMSAKSGTRTLLIDLDMRRPRLARIWKIADPEWSLLHALCDPKPPDFARLPQKTPVPGLDVIVSHVAQDLSPAEVLGSRRAREFIEWAGKNYERVIIDSPPVGLTSDAMVLGGMAGAVIMIGRFNRTQKSLAMAAVQRLVDGGAFILGMIVNDIRYAKTGFGGYGSLHRYYRHYGYGERAAAPTTPHD